MKNKTTQLIIAAVLAAGGFYLYTAYQKGMFPFKKKEPTPEPEPIKPLPISPMPAPTPTPQPAPSGSGKASSSKVKELQLLLAKRYEQLNKSGFTKSDADGAAGSVTHAAIEYLRPEIYKNFGLVNSGNVQKYIDAFTADVATRAKEEETTKTKAADVAKRVKTAKDMENLMKTGKYIAELMSANTTRELIYDNLSGSYKGTDNIRTFSKGTKFYKADNMRSRGDGTILYSKGDSRYAFNPNLFILRSI